MQEDTYNQDQRRLTIWSDLNTAGRKGTVRSRPNIHNRQNGRDGRYGDIYGSHLHFLVPVVTSIHLTEKGRNSIYCDIYN